MKRAHQLSHSTVTLLLGLLLSLSPIKSQAAEGSVIQDINLEIPLFSLIDIEDVSPSFIFISPTNAGESFNGNITNSNNNFTLSLTSNSSLADLDVHVDTDLSSKNLQLTIAATSGLCGSSQVLTTTPTKLCDIGTLQTSSASLTLTAGTVAANDMAVPGSYSANVIYTLTEN